MSDFDAGYERFRLNLLASQFPFVCQTKGEVVFLSEEVSDGAYASTWAFEADIFGLIRESGFKTRLLALLDALILYRSSHGVEPYKEGIVQFGDGRIRIEWLPYGSTHLSNRALEYEPSW